MLTLAKAQREGGLRGKVSPRLIGNHREAMNEIFDFLLSKYIFFKESQIQFELFFLPPIMVSIDTAASNNVEQWHFVQEFYQDFLPNYQAPLMADYLPPP